MWELDSKESWALKNWCFWTVVLKTLESPLDCKEIQPVHPKGNQSWIFIERTDVEAETPIFWPPDAKNWLIGKTLMLGKIEGGRRGWQRMRWLDGITTRWRWVWVRSRSWWWTGKPGMLHSMESQRVGHNCVTELNCVRYHTRHCGRNREHDHCSDETTRRIHYDASTYQDIIKFRGQCRHILIKEKTKVYQSKAASKAVIQVSKKEKTTQQIALG